MIQIYLYDENKMFTGVELVNSTSIIMEETDEIISSLPENSTEIRPKDGLYKAQFNGKEWIETITQEELKELNKEETHHPSTKERVDVLEGAILELMELLL